MLSYPIVVSMFPRKIVCLFFMQPCITYSRCLIHNIDYGSDFESVLVSKLKYLNLKPINEAWHKINSVKVFDALIIFLMFLSIFEFDFLFKLVARK